MFLTNWVKFLIQKMIIKCYLYIHLRRKYPLPSVLDRHLLPASPPGQPPLILICLSWLHCWCRLLCTCSTMTNPQLCSRLSLHIGQCCKALLPPKLDRQLLLSLPLEQLSFLWSWFHLRRLRCSQTMMTNLQPCSQLVENIVRADKIVMVARIMMIEKAVMMKVAIKVRVCLFTYFHSSRPQI